MQREPKVVAHLIIERRSGWYWVLARRSVELRVVASDRDALPDIAFHAVNDATAGHASGKSRPDGQDLPVR